MAKIGILTFHRAQNYGAALQAFALRKTIASLGHKVEVIDYGTTGETHRFNFETYGIKPFVKGMILNILSLYNADLRRYRFRKFRKEIMGVSPTRYKNRSALLEKNISYDLYVTGSDQVWNPFLTNGDSAYLLDFVNDPCKKASYATSFGVAEIPAVYKETYKKNINTIENLSVREEVGQQIIKELSGKESSITLDPTLLLDAEEWDKIAKPYHVSKPYILCFTIMSDPDGFLDFCKHLKKITGYQIIRISNPLLKIENGVKSIATAGPAEFLGLFRNASIVVTNSFHGTAFSIIYNKPFYTFLYNNDRDIRLREITGKLGLENRLIGFNSLLPDYTEISIKFSEINRKLELEKEQSLLFLKKVILTVDSF